MHPESPESFAYPLPLLGLGFRCLVFFFPILPSLLNV